MTTHDIYPICQRCGEGYHKSACQRCWDTDCGRLHEQLSDMSRRGMSVTPFTLLDVLDLLLRRPL